MNDALIEVDETLREAALEYSRYGWRIVPNHPADKRPRRKAWQREATADAAKINAWWNDCPAGNVGVLLGRRSGIIDIEGDGPGANRLFAELFAGHEVVTPTYGASTGRGVHRLFEWRPGFPRVATFSICDLEFRIGNEGAQSILPPSRHPGGGEYRWQVSPDDVDPAPIPDAVLNRILRARAEATQTNTKMNETECNALSHPVCSVSLPDAVASALFATLPTSSGKRNRQLFEFARRLLAIPELAASEPRHVRPYVVEWHRQALARIGTKSFDVTWRDFRTAWARARVPYGSDPIGPVWEVAKVATPPAFAEQYKLAGMRQLVTFTRELQRAAGAGPFFLSCRMAATLIGTDYRSANRWLRRLVRDGVLAVVLKGSATTGKASRYRYLLPH